MTTQYRTYSAHYQLGYWYNGKERIVRDRTLVYSCPLISGKTSVDTGSFIPGEYRVNPYDVWNEEIVVSDSPPSEYNWGSWPYFWRSIGTGQNAAHALTASLSTTLPSTASGLMQQALMKAQAKLGKSDLSMGEDLGELRETIQMLKSPFKELRKFLTKGKGRNSKKLNELLTFLRTGTFRGKSGKDAAKAASSTWLEFRYGFRPLIMTIGDLIEQVNRKTHKAFDPSKIRSVRAMVEANPSITRGSSSSYIWYTQNMAYWDYVNTDKLTGYAQVQYRQSKPLSALQSLGLTPRFWPETMWELTALSFVWDWFTTIGPWLGSLRFNPEITVLGHTTAVKMVRTREVTCNKICVDPGKYAPWEGSGKRVLTRYSRTVGLEPALTPSLRLDVCLDINQIVDSISLILQRILR